MATITVSPNPALPSTICTVTGASFVKAKTRLLLDGVAIALPAGNSSFLPRRDGSFTVNFTSSAIPKLQTVIAQQLTGPKVNGSTWAEVARASVVVSTPTPPVGDTTAPTVSNLTASYITQTGCTISWSLTEPATGWVEYGLSTSYGSSTPPETSFSYSAHSQTITGLLPGTRYYYRVRGADAAGNQYTSADGTYFITTAAVPPPTPPLSLAGVAGDTTASLSWQPPTGSGTITGYRVYKDTVLYASPTGTSQLVSGLTNGVSYSFTVSAVNAAGEGTQTSPVTVTPAASGSRPFAAPTTTQTVNVPGNIDSTGTTDVRAALQTFFGTVADGSIISFTANGTYRIDGGLLVDNRNDLVFEGNGATLYCTANGAQANSHFFLHNSSDIHFNGFKFKGANATPGQMSSTGEYACPVHILGGTRIEMSGGTVTDVHGDGTVVANAGVSYVWVHDVNVINCGRNAMSVVWGSHVLVEKNTIGPCGWAIFDIEPEVASNGQTLTDIAFLDNKTYGWGPYQGVYWHGFLLGASAGTGSTAIVDGIRCERNTVSHATLQSYIGWQNAAPYGRRRNITIIDNVGIAGPIYQGQPGLITFHHSDIITIGRNVLAPTSGQMYSTADDCTAVTVVT